MLLFRVFSTAVSDIKNIMIKNNRTFMHLRQSFISKDKAKFEDLSALRLYQLKPKAPQILPRRFYLKHCLQSAYGYYLSK